MLGCGDAKCQCVFCVLNCFWIFLYVCRVIPYLYLFRSAKVSIDGMGLGAADVEVLDMIKKRCTMRRIIRVFLVISVIGLFSIISNSCSQCDSSNLRYSWCSIDLLKLKITSLSNDRISFKQVDTLLYQYDRFGIQIKMTGKTLAFQPTINFGLIQNCNAQMFDCFKDYSTDNKIRGIKIITLSDFDVLHLKNSDISRFFKAALYYNKLSSIEDYLSDNNEINGSHRDLSTNFSEEINLFLNAKPTKDSIFRFAVNVILDDNTTYCDTTNEIKIK